MPRTEEEKVTQAPLKVKFGGSRLRDQAASHPQAASVAAKLQEELGPLVSGVQVANIGNRTVLAGLPAAMAQFPEKICDLIFAYAPELPKDKILEEAPRSKWPRPLPGFGSSSSRIF